MTTFHTGFCSLLQGFDFLAAFFLFPSYVKFSVRYAVQERSKKNHFTGKNCLDPLESGF